MYCEVFVFFEKLLKIIEKEDPHILMRELEEKKEENKHTVISISVSCFIKQNQISLNFLKLILN